MISHRNVTFAAALIAGVLMTGSGAVRADDPGPDLEQLASVAQAPVVTATLTLERALGLAVQGHPNLRSSRGSLQVARARVVASRSGWLPQLTLQVSRTETDLVRKSPTSGAVSAGGTVIGGSSRASEVDSDIKRAAINLRQMVTDFGRTENRIDSTQHFRQGARLDFENTVQDVVLGVQEAYFNLVAARHLAETNRQAVGRAQLHVDLARGFVEVGSRPKFDLTRAQVDLSNARVALLQAENQYELGRVTLANAMGIEGPLPGDPAERPASPMPVLTRDKALELGLATRRDLAAASEKLAAARSGVLAAQAAYRPTLNVAATRTLRGEDFPLDRQADLSVSLDWNLFDGAATRASLAEARGNVEVARGQLDALRQRASADIQQNYLNVRESRARVEATAVALGQARENLELARGRYREGVGSAIEVTDAELAITTAETAGIRAQLDSEIALARLQRAMGLVRADVAP